jgi:hypothetical protein
MATRMQTHEDVIHATDTALRLVNQALGDLGAADSGAECAASAAEQGARGSRGLRSLASTLLRAHAEVVSLLDRFDRAIAVVTELERGADAAQDRVRHARYAAIREELVGVITHARFRDSTSRQLGHVAAVIADTEERLEQLTRIFEPLVAHRTDSPAFARPLLRRR